MPERTMEIDPEEVTIDDAPVTTEGKGAIEKIVKEVVGEDFLETFSEKIAFYRKFKALCLGVTHEKDWVKYGENFYLQSTGAERLAPPLGISWGKPEVVRITNEDDSYTYNVMGEVSSKKLDTSCYEIGSCNSNDKFLSSRPGFDPIRDEAHVAKKALGNWKSRAIGVLTGMRNPPADLFAEAGLDLSRVGVVEFKTQEQKAQASTKKSPAKKKDLDAMREVAKEIARLEGATEAQIIAKFSFFEKDGKPYQVDNADYSRFSEKWAKATLQRMEEEFKKLGGAIGGPTEKD
jgi:hypothetical protein